MSGLKFPPSKAHIWAPGDGCRGWAKMSIPYSGRAVNSEKAREGNVAHSVAEAMLRGGTPAVGDIIGGGVVTEAMIRGAAMYTVECGGGPGIDPRGVEEWVTFDDGSKGKVDYWQYNVADRILTINDYKFGTHPVEAVNNWQLALYAERIVKKHDLNVVGFRLVITQPRAYHSAGRIREWEATIEEVWEMVHLAAIARNEALAPVTVCRTGTHCGTCEARHACDAHGEFSGAAMAYISSSVPHELSLDEIGVEYEMLKQSAAAVKTRLSAIEAQMKSSINAGKAVPGWTIAPGRGKWDWDAPVEDVAAVGRGMGIELCKPTELITPTQTRDNTAIPEVVLNQLTKHIPGKKVLKKVDLAEARRVFSHKGV